MMEGSTPQDPQEPQAPEETTTDAERDPAQTPEDLEATPGDQGEPAPADPTEPTAPATHDPGEPVRTSAPPPDSASGVPDLPNGANEGVEPGDPDAPGQTPDETEAERAAAEEPGDL